MQERLDDLNKRKEEALQPGSQRSVDRQHEKGKLLARERIEYLLDPGSFHELDMLARHRAHNSGIEERPLTDGVITGWGTIDGRKIFVFSQDFTVFGGALGEVFAEKIHKVMDLALSVGAPVWVDATHFLVHKVVPPGGFQIHRVDAVSLVATNLTPNWPGSNEYPAG